MTPEEILTAIGSGTRVIVSCASLAAEPPKPPFVAGPPCSICKRKLRITPRGLQQIESGGIPMCNPCAISIAERLQAAGGRVNLHLGPQAEEAVANGTSASDLRRIAKLMKRASPECDFCKAKSAGFWLFPHREFLVTLRAGNRSRQTKFESSEWAACDACAQKTQAGDVAGLVDRACLGHGFSHPELRENLRDVYSALLRHRSGPPHWYQIPVA